MYEYIQAYEERQIQLHFVGLKRTFQREQFETHHLKKTKEQHTAFFVVVFFSFKQTDNRLTSLHFFLGWSCVGGKMEWHLIHLKV